MFNDPVGEFLRIFFIVELTMSLFFNLRMKIPQKIKIGKHFYFLNSCVVSGRPLLLFLYAFGFQYANF